MQPYSEDQRAQALAAASEWWQGRPFPMTASGRAYRCDLCGGVISARAGTSLVDSDLRCADCTRRFFESAMPPSQPFGVIQGPSAQADGSLSRRSGGPVATLASPPPEGAYRGYPAQGTYPPPPPVAAYPTLQPPAQSMPTRLATRPPRRRRKWVVLAIAAVAVIGLTVGLVIWAPWARKAPPSIPANVHASPAAASVLVQWSASTSGPKVDQYLIMRSGAQVGAVPGTQTSYQDNGLKPGITYRYGVIAQAGSRRSEPSADTAVTTLTPSPVKLRPAASTTSSLSFSWSPPQNAPAPDYYVILRSGTEMARASGAARAYFEDVGLAPATSYRYQVAAQWGSQVSRPSSVLTMKTVTPPVSAARLSGSWPVQIRLTGDTISATPATTRSWTATWSTTPKCPSGPCAVTLSGDITAPEYKEDLITVTLTRSGAAYTGSTTTTGYSLCGSAQVRDTVTVRLTVKTAGVDGTAWAARSWTGTMIVDSPYTDAGDGSYCPAGSRTHSISASQS